jgi:RNA-directed DNA polymerase
MEWRTDGRLMDDRRQKNQQLELAFPEQPEGEPPRQPVERVESDKAVDEPESPADTTKLMEEVSTRWNLGEAYKRVRSNGGAPGVDGMTVEELPIYFRKHWPEIKAQLLEGTYKPKPVKKVEIPKPAGGTRQLGIPCVQDRLIQQAVLQVLQGRWDPTFSEHSYGFRPGRSAHQAIAQAQTYVAEGYEYVVDMDLEKFFDRVNHDMLMSRIAKRVEDKRLLRIIRAFLNAGIMENGLVGPARGEGVPQGGPLSPLLSNLFLDDLDRELERRGHRFVRYADDCNIYVRTERAGHRVMKGIKRYLEKKLKLKVNEKKSAVDKVNKRKFLGFSVVWSRNGQPRRSIAPASLERFKDRIRQMTRRRCGRSVEQIIERLTPYLVGWRAYFGFCETPWELRDLDGWIRRRLRAIVWEQWTTYRRRRDSLRRLGIAYRQALDAAWKGCESNSTWAMSRDSRVQRALSPKYLAALGLPSLLT